LGSGQKSGESTLIIRRLPRDGPGRKILSELSGHISAFRQKVGPGPDISGWRVGFASGHLFPPPELTSPPIFGGPRIPEPFLLHSIHPAVTPSAVHCRSAPAPVQFPQSNFIQRSSVYFGLWTLSRAMSSCCFPLTPDAPEGSHPS